jgi:hypothetical protein
MPHMESSSYARAFGINQTNGTYCGAITPHGAVDHAFNQVECADSAPLGAMRL